MAINTHHTVIEINGIRCSVIAENVSPQRAEFIGNLLKINGFEIVKAENANGKITIGISKHLWFNVVHALYGQWLKKADGTTITPYYWENGNSKDGFYWEHK